MTIGKRITNVWTAAVVVMALFTAGTSQAAWELIDDFDGYTATSDIGGTGGWYVVSSSIPNGSHTVEIDPANPYNQVVQLVTGTSMDTLCHAISITNGSIGTLFCRIRMGSDFQFFFGSSGVVNPTGWSGSIHGYGRFYGSDIDVRDGSTDVELGPYSINEWYNIWFVLNPTTDQTIMYANQGYIHATEPGTLSASGAFRTTVTDLVTAFFRNNGGTTSWIDDVYLDTTGQNLVNPAASTPVASIAGVVGVNTIKLDVTGNVGALTWQASEDNSTWNDIDPAEIGTVLDVTSLYTNTPWFRVEAISGVTTNYSAAMQVTSQETAQGMVIMIK